MRFILKTACVCSWFLFFIANVQAQTTKKIMQTFTPEKTVQSVKILSSVDSSIINTWLGDFILIYVEVKAKGMGAESSYKAEYRQEGSTAIINLNPNLPQVIVSGEPALTIVEYQIFIPDNITIE